VALGQKSLETPDVVETVIFETGTQDLKFETETSKFVYFAEIFKKCCHHGRPQGGAKRAFPPLEIGTKKQNFWKT